MSDTNDPPAAAARADDDSIIKGYKDDDGKSGNDDRSMIKGDDDAGLFERSMAAFQNIEADLNTIIQDILNDDDASSSSLKHLKTEYYKLYKALQRSNDSERRLYNKYDHLKTEMKNNITKVNTAIRLSEEDKDMIEDLKKETEKVWKMVEEADDNDMRSSNTMKALKNELNTLTRLMEEGVHLTLDGEVKVKSLEDDNDKLKDEITSLDNTSTEVIMRNNIIKDNVDKLVMDKASLSRDVRSIRNMIKDNQTESDKEDRRRHRVQSEVIRMSKKVVLRGEELNKQHANLNTVLDNLQKIEQELREDRRLHEKIMATNEETKDELNMLKEVFIKDTEGRIKAEDDCKGIENIICTTRNTLNIANHDRGKMENDIANLKLVKIKNDENKKILKDDKEKITSRVLEILNTIKTIRKLSNDDVSMVDELMGDRDVLNRSLVKIHYKGERESEEMRRIERMKDGLQYEIDDIKREVDDINSKIQTLIKQRESFGLDLSTAYSKCMRGMEEVKIRDNRVTEAGKIIDEDNTRLSIQKGLYDDARAERNECCKKLRDSEDEISSLKRKLKLMHHEIEELEEDVKAKDEAIMKECYQYNRISKSAASTRDELTKIRREQKEHEKHVEGSRGRVKELENEMKKVEENKELMKRKYTTLVAERDVLGANLVRRNDELALLYEKLRVQDNTIDQGNIESNRREDESRSMSVMLESIKGDIIKARSVIKERKLLHHHRLFMNVELEDKISELQRRLIKKCEELVDCDLVLQEKEQHKLQLHKLILLDDSDDVKEGSREDGDLGMWTTVDQAQEATDLQRELARKTKCMKSVAAELNMSYANVNELQDEIKLLYHQLAEAKEMYHDQRRRDDLDAKSNSITSK
ncbi:hypothetical protein FOL46_006854 [Perkinsus olseni]|uniref:Cilia- and flagella-associated protein 58 central coiled coil domain-containing protein n=1 Tax=Perkinsus olseni TaxID=32597 RepID=A0A7J6LHG0_PEROL|nr:hypothetical protein FOL46_006854 [Perkinsus olseni]